MCQLVNLTISQLTIIINFRLVFQLAHCHISTLATCISSSFLQIPYLRSCRRHQTCLNHPDLNRLQNR